MRYMVYMVAVLAAAGIVYYVGTTENSSVAAFATPSQVADTATDSSETPAPAGDVQLVNLKVPGMHCPMACYPAVKKTLEKESGVQGVDLVEQKEEGVIDNPVVVIRHDPEFDLDGAVASLEKLGFEGAVTVAK